MNTPAGFVYKVQGGKLYKLKKSLYGLKLSSGAWFKRFNSTLKGFEYSQVLANHALFTKRSHNSKVIILIVYKDDIIIMGDNA